MILEIVTRISRDYQQIAEPTVPIDVRRCIIVEITSLCFLDALHVALQHIAS